MGLEWEIADAHVNASSKVDFRRNPPKIIKLCRLRYWGCIICTDWMVLRDMRVQVGGRREGVLGSKGGG